MKASKIFNDKEILAMADDDVLENTSKVSTEQTQVEEKKVSIEQLEKIAKLAIHSAYYYFDVPSVFDTSAGSKLEFSIKKKNSDTDSYQAICWTKEDSGVFLTKTTIKNSKSGGTKSKTTTELLCSYVDIAEKIESKNESNGEIEKFIKVIFLDENGNFVEKYFRNDYIFDSAGKSEALDQMIKLGFLIEHQKKAYVIDYLKTLWASGRVPTTLGTTKTGWHFDKETDTYEYVGQGLNTSNIVYTGSSQTSFQKNGDFEAQKLKMATIFRENTLVFAICAYAATGYFLRFLNLDINQIMAITGISSKGKTTAGKVALSLFTSPENHAAFSGTAYGITEVIKAHNDNYLLIDETKESTIPTALRESMIYSMANGTTKLKGQKVDGVISVQHQKEKYRFSVLITGELSFLKGTDIQGTGLDARYIELWLPETVPLWDSIKDNAESEALMQFCHKHHGHFAEPYINLLKEKKEEIVNKYIHYLEEIRNEIGETDPILKRKARILASTKVAAELLASLIFDKDISIEIANDAYLRLKESMSFSKSIELKEDNLEKLSHIENSLAAHFDVYKSIANKGLIETKIDYNINKAYFGFIKINETEKTINIVSTAFNEFCKVAKFEEKLFIAWADEKGFLVKDKDRYTKKIQINGAAKNYYVIKLNHELFDEPEQIDLLERDFDTPFKVDEVMETPFDRPFDA